MAEVGPDVRIALIGDRDPSVVAHRAVPAALALAARDIGVTATAVWHHTTSLSTDGLDAVLEECDGIWAVPATPYTNTEGAIAAIRFARERRVPFLGTCGGFQHAMIEYARSVLGERDAAHAELDPSASDPVIAPLTCSLVEVTGSIRLSPGTRIHTAYGVDEIIEGYHCRYGVSPRFASRLARGPLHVTARDPAGDVRAVELHGHPFFVGTLFQPERAALEGRVPALVHAFLEAASAPHRAAA